MPEKTGPASTPVTLPKAAPAAQQAAPVGQTATPKAKKPMTFEAMDDAAFADTPEGALEQTVAEDDGDDLDDGDEDDSTGESDLSSEEEGDLDSEPESENADSDEEEALDDEAEEEGEEEGETGEDKEALHEVKVNGEKKKFTLAQLKQIASSGFHTIQKYNEFQREVAGKTAELDEARAQVSVVNAKITPIYDKLKSGDVAGSILEVGKSIGKSKLDLERILLKQHIPLVAKRLGLHPDFVQDRLEKMKANNDFLDTQQENAYLKESRDEEAKARESKPEKSKEVVEAEKQFRKFQADNSVPDSEMAEAFHWVVKNKYSGDQNKVTYEDITGLVLDKRTVNRAIDAILYKRPKLAGNQKFVDKTVRLIKQHPDWTPDRVGRWIEKQARKISQGKDGTDLARDISRKVLKNGLKPRFENPSGQQRKPMKFSDLNAEDDKLM